jgi:hypothetical protein
MLFSPLSGPLQHLLQSVFSALTAGLPPDVAAWLLMTGFWNEAGVWDDAAFWID